MRKSTSSPLICCVDESHLYKERNEVEQLGHRRNYDRLDRLRNSAQRWPHTYRASALRFSRARAYTHGKYVRCDKSWPAGRYSCCDRQTGCGVAQIKPTNGKCTVAG